MEMKRVIKRITTGEDAARIRSNIAGVLAVLWMIVIFILSGQNKEESGAISGGCATVCWTSAAGFYI